MFEIRFSTDPEGETFDILQLDPAPTDVEYPSRRHFNQLSTDSGALVVQRFHRDDRPRKWVWRWYSEAIPSYAALWPQLEALEAKERLEAGLDPIVEIRDGWHYTEWLPVKILHVDRYPRKGGGPIIYETSEVEFYLA